MPKKTRWSSLDPKYLTIPATASVRPMDSWIRHDHLDIVSEAAQGMQRVGTRDTLPQHRERRLSDGPSERPTEMDFALQPVVDMEYQARKVVAAINHHKHSTAIAQAKRAFLDAYEGVNLCWQCKFPIRVLKYVKAIGKIVVPSQYNPAVLRTEYQKAYGIYADIPSHYEWLYEADGSKRAFYRYIDGTDRDIRLKRTPKTFKRQAKRGFEQKEADSDGNVTRTHWTNSFIEILEDGSEVPVVPETSYRIDNRKCECPMRRAKVVKVNRV